MSHFRNCVGACALLLGAVSVPCLADSSAASASSGSVATSVGSLSDSVKKSSNSSSRGTDVAEGDYRIVEVTEVAQRPGTDCLTLQATADPSADGGLLLCLPATVVDQNRLARGQIVAARHRPYGVEFVRGETGQAFFLALEDEWLRELGTHAVSL